MQMHPSNYVNVRILCRCGHELALCLLVGTNVPGPLRCSPGPPIAGGSSRSDIFCPRCRDSLFSSVDVLRKAAEDELHRGRGRHVSQGAVVLVC